MSLLSLHRWEGWMIKLLLNTSFIYSSTEDTPPPVADRYRGQHSLHSLHRLCCTWLKSHHSQWVLLVSFSLLCSNKIKGQLLKVLQIKRERKPFWFHITSRFIFTISQVLQSMIYNLKCKILNECTSAKVKSSEFCCFWLMNPQITHSVSAVWVAGRAVIQGDVNHNNS